LRAREGFDVKILKEIINFESRTRKSATESDGLLDLSIIAMEQAGPEKVPRLHT
jgi:uncharacterized protein (UPF0335 family)